MLYFYVKYDHRRNPNNNDRDHLVGQLTSDDDPDDDDNDNNNDDANYSDYEGADYEGADDTSWRCDQSS